MIGKEVEYEYGGLAVMLRNEFGYVKTVYDVPGGDNVAGPNELRLIRSRASGRYGIQNKNKE